MEQLTGSTEESAEHVAGTQMSAKGFLDWRKAFLERKEHQKQTTEDRGSGMEEVGAAERFCRIKRMC